MFVRWNWPRKKLYVIYFGTTGFLVLMAILSKRPAFNQDSSDSGVPVNHSSKLVSEMDSRKLEVSTDASNSAQHFDSGNDGQHFDNGNSVQHFDSGKSVQHFDSGNSVQHFDSGNDVQHFDNGNSVKHFDSGNDVQHFDSGNDVQHFDNGNDVQHFDSGNDVQHFDSGNFVQHFDSGNDVQHFDSGKLDQPKLPTKLVSSMDSIADDDHERPKWDKKQTQSSENEIIAEEENNYIDLSYHQQPPYFVDKTRKLKQVNLQNENSVDANSFYTKKASKQKHFNTLNQFGAARKYSSAPEVINLTSKPVGTVGRRLRKITGGTSLPYKYLFNHLIYTTKLQLKKTISGNDLSPDFNPGTTLPLDRINHVLIASTWRSGSTFLGDILNSYPGAFYSFEPLHIYLKNQHLEDGDKVPASLQLIRDIYTCNYTSNIEYIKYMQANEYLMSHNTHAWKACSLNKAFCFDAQFLTDICRLYPLNVIKSVRLGLSPIAQLLSDKDLNVKVIHLVRDPRGSLQSRRNLDWCISDVCIDPGTICQHLQMDLELSRKYALQFPDKFFFVRYEDLSLEPERITKEILDFIGLRHHENIDRFLKVHTQLSEVTTRKKKLVGTYTTFRDSQKIPFAWRDKLSFEDVRNIQNNCEIPLETLGYKIFNSEEEYNNKSIPVLMSL